MTAAMKQRKKFLQLDKINSQQAPKTRKYKILLIL